jgi:hypothetical protein
MVKKIKQSKQINVLLLNIRMKSIKVENETEFLMIST